MSRKESPLSLVTLVTRAENRVDALLLSGIAVLASGDTPETSAPPVRTAIAVVALLAGARLLWTGYTQTCRLNRRLGRNTYRG